MTTLWETTRSLLVAFLQGGERWAWPQFVPPKHRLRLLFIRPIFEQGSEVSVLQVSVWPEGLVFPPGTSMGGFVFPYKSWKNKM